MTFRSWLRAAARCLLVSLTALPLAAEALQEAGWQDVTTNKLDVECRFPLSAMDLYVSLMGPVGYAMAQGVDEATKEKVIEVVRAAFMEFAVGDEIVFTAACWKTAARAA